MPGIGSTFYVSSIIIICSLSKSEFSCIKINLMIIPISHCENRNWFGVVLMSLQEISCLALPCFWCLPLAPVSVTWFQYHAVKGGNLKRESSSTHQPHLPHPMESLRLPSAATPKDKVSSVGSMLCEHMIAMYVCVLAIASFTASATQVPSLGSLCP